MGNGDGLRVTDLVRVTEIVGLIVIVRGWLVAIAEGDPLYFGVMDAKDADGVRVTGVCVTVRLMVRVTEIVCVGVTYVEALILYMLAV